MGASRRLQSLYSQEEMVAWAGVVAVSMERKDGFGKRPADKMAWIGNG